MLQLWIEEMDATKKNRRNRRPGAGGGMSGYGGSPTVRGRRKSCGQMTDGSSLCEPVRLGMRQREAVIVWKKSLVLPGKSGHRGPGNHIKP